MPVLKCKVTGLPPGMLQNNPAFSLFPAGPKSRKERVPKPEDEAEMKAYRDEDGGIVFPTFAVLPCLVHASRGYKFGRRGAPGIITGAILNVTSAEWNEEWLPMLDLAGNQLTEYEIDVRRVVVQRAGVLRARPLLPEWMTEVHITYSDAFIEEDALLATFVRAGIMSGWGDFRPQRGGKFGRFEVVRL